MLRYTAVLTLLTLALFAGVNWRPKPGNRWTFDGRFDVGAGGSDLVWNAWALFDVEIG